MKTIIGVDLGGTTIKVAAVTEDGNNVFGIVRTDTNAEAGADHVVSNIFSAIEECRSSAEKETNEKLDILGIGIGSPGPIDTKRGIVVTSPNLRWVNMPLRDKVEERFGLDATLENDANCAVLGEWWRGAAQGANIVVGVTIGTGVGGGFILDGKIFHGASDVAGEFGHVTIDSTGRRCGCGNYGCLEAYASGKAIAKRAVESIQAGADSTIAQHAGGDVSKITAEHVYAAAAEGDDLAREVVRDTARFLGTGIASLVNICNPEIVVICGGVTQAGDQLFRPLKEEISKRAFKRASEVVTVVPGQLPGTAGIVGAARAFQTFQEGK